VIGFSIYIVFIQYTQIHAVILFETIYFGSQKIFIVVYTVFSLMYKNEVTHKITFIIDVTKLGKDIFKSMRHSVLCTGSVLRRRRTRRSPRAK
jgi:hypothetical protein